MVAPGRRHASLIPSHSFARRIATSVQHRGYLVVTVANSHTTNDLQRLHRRGGPRCGARPLHRELRMRASLPVNHQLKGLFILVSAHDDLFDGCAEDHLLEWRRTVVTLPDSTTPIAVATDKNEAGRKTYWRVAVERNTARNRTPPSRSVQRQRVAVPADPMRPAVSSSISARHPVRWRAPPLEARHCETLQPNRPRNHRENALKAEKPSNSETEASGRSRLPM